MREDRLFLPRGDTYTAPIQAMERVIGELPLEGCELVRNPDTDVLEFQAPPGKAFHIKGPNLRTDRIKPLYVGSRTDADSPVVKDPLELDRVSPWDEDTISEHVATKLSLRTNGHLMGRDTLPHEEWTQHSYSVSSDEVEIDVVLLDHPQAWTYTGLRPVAIRQNDSSYAHSIHTYADDDENHGIGMRQGMIHGRADEVIVELVDVDYDRLTPNDGIIRSADGRELQIAGTHCPQVAGIQEVRTSSSPSAKEYDGFYMDGLRDAYALGGLPDQERIEALWRGHRNKIVGGNYQRSSFGPFSDDPLAAFDIVYADPKTGRVGDMEDLLILMKRTAELSAMLPHELEALEDDDSKRVPKKASLEFLGKAYLESIPVTGSLSSAAAQYAGPGWELAAGQRRHNEELFGWHDFPHIGERVVKMLARMTLDEAVEEFASPDWYIRDAQDRRTTCKPRYEDVYLEALGRGGNS